MGHDPDKQVLNAAGGLGCFAFAAALALIPLFLPAYILYKLTMAAGAASLHPAVMIVLAALAIWGLWRMGGMLIRSVSPRAAQLAIALYVGVSYAFVFFQRPLTTAPAELDVAWLALVFAAFSLVGWKIGCAMVLKAHRDRLIRAQRKEQSAV